MHSAKMMSFLRGTNSGKGGGSVEIIAKILGAINLSIKLVNEDPNGSAFIKEFGIYFSGVKTSLDGYRVYNQYKNGNINPVDAISVSAGTLGIWAKVMSRLGFGGAIAAYTARVAGYAGFAVAIYQSWSVPYKLMDQNRYATPLHFDTDQYGDPVSFQDNSANW